MQLKWLKALALMRYINLRFTYLLTYLVINIFCSLRTGYHIPDHITEFSMTFSVGRTQIRRNTV